MFEIEKNIPIPSSIKRKISSRNKLYPFSSMAVGDSFAIPFNFNGKTPLHIESNVDASLYLWEKRNNLGNLVFMTHIMHDKKEVRIWRIK